MQDNQVECYRCGFKWFANAYEAMLWQFGATGYFEAKFDGEFARVREFSNV